LNNRRRMAAGLSTIGFLALFASGLEADDLAYALGATAEGPTNPFGTVDLNSGAFTLIGSMGSGGYSGLAVANGVLYTEQNGLLYSVNTSNANLTLIGGLTGNNFGTFGSTTTGLYGVAGTGNQNVATLFSISPQTGAVTAIGPVGVIGNGQFAFARLSVGSSTLYMENAGNLYTINTTTGAGTQVGTTDTNNFLTSVLLFENGTYYDGYGPGIGTVNITTGQITPHSSVTGGNNYVSGLAPLSTSSGPSVTRLLPQLVFGGAWYTALYFTNTTNSPVSFTTSFFGNDGTPLNVAALGGTSITTNLAARGTAIVEFPNLDSTVLGYASAALPSGVTGYGVFRQSISGVNAQEAVVPLSINTATTSTMLFDDTKYVTAFAVVNLSSAANTIAVVARDTQGNTLGTASIPLAANAKTSMVLNSIIPAIKGAIGSVDFTVSSGNLAVLGLRFNDLAFTSIPTSDR
jgi:hypothetical protein